MRIGIDATALPPQPVGAGNYIIQLIRALAAADNDDQLVVFTQGKGPALLDLPEETSVEWQIVKDRTPGSRLIWEQTRLPRLVKGTKVDLLHSLHYTRPMRLPCASVVTFHDMTFFLYPQLHTRARRMFFPSAIRASARQADALITVSESTRQDAIRLLAIDPGKIFTTHLGVDPSFRLIDNDDEKKTITAKYHLPENFILYLGTIEPRKNLPILVRAYRRLIDSGMSHKLVLVGKYGWMYEEVLGLVKELDLEDMVCFTGYVSQDDLPLVYNLASLFVYPTIYEGFGLPVLEAMACGVPVISTRIASLPEIIGDAGILIPVNDVDALFDAMVRVLGDQTLREEFIRNGQLRSKKFSWERTAQLTRQVYQQVLETS
ncbi:MAG TPA: glycosyltransferase family 1 protein [Anaerolineales bacterium]|nr:glycosyltransferase family 1 protein [Anaerolineales bacterium]